MFEVLEKLLIAMLFIIALVIGSLSWTQGITSSYENIKISKQLQAAREEYDTKIENLTNRTEALNSKLNLISDLTLAEKQALNITLQTAEIKKQYEKVTSLMRVVQDNPEKIFEFKDIKLKQETDTKLIEQKITSLDKIVSIQLNSLTSQIETAKFYNNILIGIVLMTLGVIWRQSRSHNIQNKTKQQNRVRSIRSIKD